jgi:hypothetical protein
MRLWEEVPGAGGEKYPRELGHATWRRVPGGSVREFAVEFSQPPTTGTVFLETDNGDNPPVELRNFRVFHPVTRLIFKAPSETTEPLRLCYGNRHASAPRYDISLVAAQLLSAEKGAASLGPQDSIARKPSPTPTPTPQEQAGVVFWVVLALVVVGLLVVVARLLPKAPDNT